MSDGAADKADIQSVLVGAPDLEIVALESRHGAWRVVGGHVTEIMGGAAG